jgi:hypothetical protein
MPSSAQPEVLWFFGSGLKVALDLYDLTATCLFTPISPPLLPDSSTILLFFKPSLY